MSVKCSGMFRCKIKMAKEALLLRTGYMTWLTNACTNKLQINNKVSKSQAHQDTSMHVYKVFNFVAFHSYIFKMIKLCGRNKK